MKKILTLTAAVLASFSLWAAVPSGTLDPVSVPTTGWKGLWAPASVESGDWVCFSPYEIYNSTQDWAAKDNSGSTSGSWEATSPFPASTAWTTNDGKVATVRQGQKGPYYYRVTNTIEAAALVKSGSNKKRTIFLEAYELTDGVAPASPTKTTSMESSTTGVISVSELNAAKEYLIVVRAEDSGTGGSSSGNSNYYSIAFKHPEIDLTKATLTGIKVNGEAIDGFDAANTTCNYELPFGTADAPEVTATTGNKATVSITQADSPTGTATIVCTSGDGTSETKTYTVNFSIKATANNDATLSDIKVNGTSVAGFATDTYEYNIGNYGVYAVIDVVGTLNDENASLEVEEDGENGKILLKVTAEDTTTKLTYTLNFTRNAATALAEISDDTTWDWAKAGDLQTSALSATTSPKQSDEINFADVLTNYDASFNAAALSGIVQWYNRKDGDNYYAQGNSIKFKTTVPGTLVITFSGTNNNSRVLKLNGTQVGEYNSNTAKDSNPIAISAGEVLIEAYEGENVSMARIYKLVFTKDNGGATAIDNTDAAVKATKVLRDGQVLILRDGKFFNALGVEVK